MSLTEALFPGQNDHLPQNRLLNFTYDCSTTTLLVHAQITTKVEIIPHILSFNNLTFSIQVNMDVEPTLNVAVLSGNTVLLDFPAFVAVKYNVMTHGVIFKGVPTAADSMTLQNALAAVSGSTLIVPPGINNVISKVTFLGENEHGATTISIKGKSNGNAVVLLYQVPEDSMANTTAALLADIHNITLESFIRTALDRDISNIPLFGALTLPRVGFSSTTGEITTSLLSTPNSPLITFETTLPKGITAYFTANIDGIGTNGMYLQNNLLLKPLSSFSLQTLLSRHPSLHVLDSVPLIGTDVVNALISSILFDPQNEQLVLRLSLPELSLIPTMMKMSRIDLKLAALIGTNPSIEEFSFSGVWTVGTVNVSTFVTYNKSKNLYHIRATPKDARLLRLDYLMKNVAGVHLPLALSSSALSSIVGNVYSNANYYIVMTGNGTRGRIYFLVMKDSSGVKVGVAASVELFQLSDLVESVIGADITNVSFFGNLVVPAMAISITSGVMQSQALPHIFGKGSLLLTYGDTLPAGVTAHFNLDIPGAEGVVGRFDNGIVTLTLPEPLDFSMEDLSSQIPAITSAIQSLPSDVTSILQAKVHSFSFNSTGNDVSIVASMRRLNLINDFLSLSDVHIIYKGTLGSTLVTNALDITGSWHIVDRVINCTVTLDGMKEEFLMTGHSSEENMYITDVVQSLITKRITLPSDISLFTLTGITGKIISESITLVLNGVVGSGKVSAVLQKLPMLYAGAVVVDISHFSLADLVLLATGYDISEIPFFGSMDIPQLTFAIATDNITNPMLRELSESSPLLHVFRSGFIEGVSGRFLIQIGDVSGIAVKLLHNKLTFKVSNRSFLSLNTVLSVMPSIRDSLNTLPSQMTSVLSAKINSFSFHPDSNELIMEGSIGNSVEVVPQLLSLSNVKISVVYVLGPREHIDSVNISGNWNLGHISIQTTLSYNGRGERIYIAGGIEEGSGITINDLIVFLFEKTIQIPSVLSFVTLSSLSGLTSNNVTLIALSGSVSEGHIYFFYQKAPAGSAVAIAAHVRNFRLSSLVSSAVGIDISSIPFFGPLIIPEVVLTISSKHINNPLFSFIYPTNSPLAIYGNSISEGVTATFTLAIGKVQGVTANFANGELELAVPDGAILPLDAVLQLLPNLHNAMNLLPDSLQALAGITVDNLYYKPSMQTLQLTGTIDQLSILPNFLSIHNTECLLSANIGGNSAITFVSFKGEWIINSLSFVTEVIYDNDMFLIDAQPERNESFGIKEFLNSMTQEKVNIPSAIDEVTFTKVIGMVEGGTQSLVFIGKIGSQANISIVYEKSLDREVVVFAADIKQFKLSNLIQTGTGIDISNVPLLGTLILPALSFVVSSKNFSTINLPDINVPGIPTELLLEDIPEGIKGQLKVNIGNVVGAIGQYSQNILTIETPSLSLLDMVSMLPQIRSSIDSLPSSLRSIRNTRITRLVYTPTTNSLLVMLSINSLTIVPPEIISLENISVSLYITLTGIPPSLQGHEQATLRHHNQELYDHENAELQAVTLNTMVMKGIWAILDIQIPTTVEYDVLSQEFTIEGVPQGVNSLSLTDLNSKFSSATLQLPSSLSSIIVLESFKAVSSDSSTTIIFTARITTADIYVVLQKAATDFTIAVAADIQQLTLVELIQIATNVDVSSVPFISSFEISSMAFTASTGLISTPLLATTFRSDSSLHDYTDGIPEGLTANFKVLIGECLEIQATYVENILDFAVPSKCKLSLRSLLSEIPVIKHIVKVLPSPISDLLASDINVIHFDPRTKALSVECSLSQLTFIPNVMEVNNLKISLITKISSDKNAGLQSLEFVSDWILQQVSVQIMVSYNRQTQEVEFKAHPMTGLSIAHVLNYLANTRISLPSFLDSIKLTKIIGLKAADAFTFVLSGRIHNMGVHVVYYNREGINPHIAVAAGIESFRLADLINEAIGVDISNIPFFGSVQVPRVGLSVAKGTITTPLLNQVLSSNSPLTRYDNILPDGFTAKFDLPLDGNNGLIGSYAKKIISFVPARGRVSIGSLLNEIPGVDVNSLDVIPVFGDILDIGLENVTFDIPQEELHIEMYINQIPLFGRALSIHDIHLKLNASFSDPIELYAEASGTVALGKTDYVINIYHSAITSKYVLTLKAEKLPIFSIISAVGASFLPPGLQTLLGRIFDINILDATISYAFGVNPRQLLISGMPQLFGLKTVHLTALVIEQTGGTQFIQKYIIPKLSISDLIKKLLGGSFGTKILNQLTDISFIVSPISLQGVSLSLPEFDGIDINQGLSISTELEWPSDCSDESFCKVMRFLIGDGKLSLQGTIASVEYYSISASVSDVTLGGGVVLKRAGLQFVGGVGQSLGLVGSIELKSPPVTLTAAIKLTVSGIKLEGSMSGCWYNAFGSLYITLCNLYLSMTILPVAPPITGLEFGGRVEIGKQSCSKGTLLTAEAYVGINAFNPKENYFYADIGSLTFQSLFDAFCIDVSLPRPLGDSGFPKGLKTSFSLLGKQLPHAGISIPAGFRFKGAINILGLQASADVTISPVRFKLQVELPAINIAGILKMYKSSVEKSTGPFIDVDIGIERVPSIEASGFIEVLGISAEAKLTISSSIIEFFVAGRFLGVFEASLRISATYGSISNAGYEVEGHFKSDLFDRIAQGIRDVLQKSADEADRHISAAQNKLDEAKSKFDDAINGLENAKRKVDDAKKVFDVAIGGLENARRKLDNVCHIRSCSSSKCLIMIILYTLYMVLSIIRI